MSDLPYILTSAVMGFLSGAIFGALCFGIPGEAIGAILGMWIVMLLLRRKHASAE